MIDIGKVGARLMTKTTTKPTTRTHTFSTLTTGHANFIILLVWLIKLNKLKRVLFIEKRQKKKYSNNKENNKIKTTRNHIKMGLIRN